MVSDCHVEFVVFYDVGNLAQSLCNAAHNLDIQKSFKTLIWNNLYKHFNET